VPLLESEAQAVRQHLERVLESPGFSRNERLSGFLRFVVERHLEGRDNELKESVIAIQVFGRRPDFDSRLDPVVRTEAVRLRARLSAYYSKAGQADALVIELPKGGYVPRFREVEEKPPLIPPIPEKTSVRFSARLWLALGLACLVTTLAVVGWWWSQHRSAPIAIAVLPLENTSHDPANDYLADGLTDELIRNLALIEGLAPRSRTSSFTFKGKPRKVSEVAKQLGVDYILEGSVLRSGPQVRINVQLIRARDDFPVWAGRYDRQAADLFTFQDEISRGIVNSLRLKLGHGRRRYETSAEAYDLYLQARALPDQRDRLPALKAAALYEQVIAKDPSFAPAYAGMAAAYAASSQQGFKDDHGYELARMRMAAEKALKLDPLLAEAHQALGTVYARQGQWSQAERSFRRAIELNPGNSLAYSDLSLVLLLPLGRIGEAVHEMTIAEQADPLSPWIQYTLAWVLLSNGSYEEAAGHCQKGTLATECLGRVRLAQGRVDEAIRILKTGPNPRYLGYAYGRAGRREEAEKTCGSRCAECVLTSYHLCRVGRQGSDLRGTGPSGGVGCRSNRASPQFP
jgi:serine/threonine-protein kinase